jgi:hypothetical protein
LGGNSGGGGKSSRGGGGESFSDNWLSQKETDAVTKQTKQLLRGKSQEEIKRYATATEKQIQSLTSSDYAHIGPKNYQRMVIEYHTANDLIKRKR